jgi:hypothetical protein
MAERSFLIHYDESDTNRLEEIMLKAQSEQILISTIFLSHPH